MSISLQGGSVTKDNPTTAKTEPEKVGNDEIKEAVSYKMVQAFINNTDLEICDLIIHVSGDKNDPQPPAGPTMIHVLGHVVESDGRGKEDLGEVKPNGTDVHFRFKNCVGNGDKFKINIQFDRPFKHGESVTYTPTDDEGAAIA